MKNIFFILLLVATFNSQAQYNKATLQASGLTCSMCNKAIYKAIGKLNFVDTVTTDIKTSTYTIIFKTNTTVDVDAVKNAVTNAGFSVANMQLFVNANNWQIQNNQHIQVGNHYLHFINVPTKQIDGEIKVTVLDKHFTTDKVHKKYSTYTTMSCYKTGKMEACCTKNEKVAITRVFHVTI